MPGSSPPASPQKILVIDDVRQLRELVSTVLEDEGFEVDGAADTTLAGLKLLAWRPDLVLLDLNLPGVGGFTYLEYVREVVADPPPVVILSGAPSLKSVLRGVKLGAFSFVPKPVHFGRLVDTCRAALERAQAPNGASGDDRRSEARRPVLVQVGVVPESDRSVLEDLVGSGTGRRQIVGEMIDVSAGGARVVAMADFPVGTRVQVTPSPAVVGSSVTLTAEVRWSESVETGHMLGLQFVDLDPEVERLLHSHLGESPHSSD